MPHRGIGSISHVGDVLFGMAKDAASQLHRRRSGDATPPMSSSHTIGSMHTLSPPIPTSPLPHQPGTPPQAPPRSPKQIARAIGQTFTLSVSSLETHHKLHSYNHVLLRKVAQTRFTRSEIDDVRRMAGDLVEWMQPSYLTNTRSEAASLLSVIAKAPDLIAFTLLDTAYLDTMQKAISSPPTSCHSQKHNTPSPSLGHLKDRNSFQELATLLSHLPLRYAVSQHRQILRSMSTLPSPISSEKLMAARGAIRGLLDMANQPQAEIWLRLLICDLLAWFAKHEANGLNKILLEEDNHIASDIRRLARASLGGLASNKLARRLEKISKIDAIVTRVKVTPEKQHTKLPPVSNDDEVVGTLELEFGAEGIKVRVEPVEEVLLSSVRDEVQGLIQLSKFGDKEAKQLREKCNYLLDLLESDDLLNRAGALSILLSVANIDSTTAFVLTEQSLYSRLSGMWRSGSAPVADLFRITNSVLDRRLKMSRRVIEKHSHISSGLSTREVRTLGIVFDDLVEICDAQGTYPESAVDTALASLKMAAESSDSLAFLLVEKPRYDRLKAVCAGTSAPQSHAQLLPLLRQAHTRKIMAQSRSMLRKMVNGKKKEDTRIEDIGEMCQMYLQHARDPMGTIKVQQSAIESILVIAEGSVPLCLVLLESHILSSVTEIVSSPVAPPLASDLGDVISELQEVSRIYKLRRILEQASANLTLDEAGLDLALLRAAFKEALRSVSERPEDQSERATKEALAGLLAVATGWEAARRAIGPDAVDDAMGEAMRWCETELEGVLRGFLDASRAQIEKLVRLGYIKQEKGIKSDAEYPQLICMRLIKVCLLDIESWATDTALELLTAIAKAEDACASILLHDAITQGLHAVSTATSRFQGQTGQSKTVATRIIALIRDVRLREDLRILREDFRDGNKIYEETYLLEACHRLLAIYSEHVWARNSVVSTFIMLAKSKNGAVLGREDPLRSMDSLFAGADVTGLDELRSLVESVAIM